MNIVTCFQQEIECLLVNLSLLAYLTCAFIVIQKVFKNHGASAGASLSHSHSQIIALPVVPTAVSARIDCMKQYFEHTGKCKLCEVRVEELLIDESAHFISIVPFAATFPFEIWIIPRDHSSHFHELDNGKVIFGFGFPNLELFH